LEIDTPEGPSPQAPAIKATTHAMIRSLCPKHRLAEFGTLMETHATRTLSLAGTVIGNLPNGSFVQKVMANWYVDGVAGNDC
jgi:hypothetical protein